jgi:hypothetical protein
MLYGHASVADEGKASDEIDLLYLKATSIGTGFIV